MSEKRARRTTNQMPIADEETRDYLLTALHDRVLGAGEELVLLAQKEEAVGALEALVAQARCLVAAYDAWGRAKEGGL